MEKGRVAPSLIIVAIILSVFSFVIGVYTSGVYAFAIFHSSPFYGFVDSQVLLSFIHGYMALASCVLGVLLPFSVLKLLDLKQQTFAASLLFLCAIMIFVHYELIFLADLYVFGGQNSLAYLGVLIGAFLFIFAGFSVVLGGF